MIRRLYTFNNRILTRSKLKKRSFLSYQTYQSTPLNLYTSGRRGYVLINWMFIVHIIQGCLLILRVKLPLSNVHGLIVESVRKCHHRLKRLEKKKVLVNYTV